MSELISVILPFHLNKNQKYLDLCTESLLRQENVDFEVIVVSSAEHPPSLPNDPRFKLFHETETSYYAHKINKGVKLSDPNSKYIMLASDDLIFGKNALEILSKTMGDNKLILNAFSNCDNYWQYHTPLTIGGKLTPRFLSIEDITDYDEIMNLTPNLDITIKVRFNCFYATMIPRSVWDELGVLDEGFLTGGEDLDYCMRADQKGIPSMITFRTFIFHFGGKTSSETVKDADRENNDALLLEKWGIKQNG